MVRGFDIAASKVSAAPLPVRAANAASMASGAGARANPVVETADPHLAGESNQQPRLLRYNSFEFRYRQDVGRIVLIGQSPETGERVVQVPSEQALRVYAQRARAEKLQDRAQLLGVEAQAGASAPEAKQNVLTIEVSSSGPAAQPSPVPGVDVTI